MSEIVKNRVQGMVRSIEQYRNGDSNAILAGSHAQVLYALTDARHDVLALWSFAESAADEITRLVEENRRLTQERDDLAKALDSVEIDGGLTSNGNLWRFWSARAKGVAAKYLILKARALHAEAACADLAADAEAVCWFDWSDNDSDAVAAVDRLRSRLAALPTCNGDESYTLTAWMVRENERDEWDFVRLKKSATDLEARGYEVVPLYARAALQPVAGKEG